MSPRRSTQPARLSPVLTRLIEAAEQHGEDAEGRDLKGAAQALREFGGVALWVLPVHGVFVPNNDDVSTIIERIATQHLGLKGARAEFRRALETIEPFERRDPIEAAHGHVRGVADEAYFYAGLAFGVTLSTAG